MEELNNPFWKFSLDRYARPGVAQICLQLQDQAGADVNIALFVLWMGAAGKRMLADTGMPLIDEHVHSWHHEIVVPLRAARRAMKGRTGPDAGEVELLRNRLKKVEVESEQMEQAILYALAKSTGPALAVSAEGDVLATMTENLMLYLAHIGSRAPEMQKAARDLATLCQ